jgi:hypothetical protein
MFLRKVDSHKIYTAPHPRRRHSSTFNILITYGTIFNLDMIICLADKTHKDWSLLQKYEKLQGGRMFASHTCDAWLLSWSRFLLEKLVISQMVKKLQNFHGTRRLIVVFITAYSWSLSWNWLIQSIPSYHIPLRSIISVSFRLHLISQEISPQGFRIKFYMNFYLLRAC